MLLGYYVIESELVVIGLLVIRLLVV